MQNLVLEIGGKQNKVLTGSRRVVPTGQGLLMSPGLPPHPSQLLPGAGDGATGGLRRTPGKGRKAGGDVVGRKKFWGVTGKPGGSFGGDSEGEELGEEWRPAEEESGVRAGRRRLSWLQGPECPSADSHRWS